MCRDNSTDEGPRPADGLAEPIVEGRCTRCWGRVRLDCESGEVARVECALCTNHLAGQDADNEWKSVMKEVERNTPSVSLGKAATYRPDAKFVAKVIPDMRRDKARVDAEIRAAMGLPSKSQGSFWITRHDVPPGTAEFLYLQAKLLAAGARSLPREVAINRWDEIESIQLVNMEIEKHEESGARIRTEVLGSPRTEPGTWDERAGAIMMRAMMAAFCCEVALKAILMTRNHRARKTHDLLALYDDLPEDCRARMNGDYAAIEDVLENSRQTFAKWRYFESETTKDAIERTLNHERAQDLEKAARVIIDECAFVGLKGDLRMTTYGSWTAMLEGTATLSNFRERMHFKADSGESAIDWPN